ncbi:adhesin [Morganella morganii]|uniref:MrpH family fimbial adhesin n=1 Tax=Morganella morganii TaxID=582 RepID=UPI0029D01204|nr:adhesin [Morganella morganii]
MNRFVKIITAFALLWSASAGASIFSYITESSGTPSNAIYTYIIERWDPEDPSAPNPCYGWSVCWININHKHDVDGSPGSSTKSIVRVEKLRTLAEVRDAVLNNISLPYNGTAKHVGPALNSNQECVGLFYESASGGWSKNGRLLPGSLCGIAPPPVGACEVTSGSVILDYGDIDEVSLPDAARNQNITVTCNLDMDILVIASGSDSGRVPLRPDNSLYADLYLNGNPGEQGAPIHVPAGGATQVDVKSVLKVNGRVAPGAFEGSGSIILVMP